MTTIIGRYKNNEPGHQIEMSNPRPTTYETPGRQLYALLSPDPRTKNDIFYLEGFPVHLVNIIHGTGEIRWTVNTWRSYDDQAEMDRLAIDYFRLEYPETKDHYDFRVKHVGDYRKWEEIPYFRIHNLTSYEARHQAVMLSCGNNVYEIRYNLLGSLQGHYVAGSTESRVKHLSRDSKS